MRVVLEADVDASPATVFAAITADPSTWTWFPIRVRGHARRAKYASNGNAAAGAFARTAVA